MGKLTNLGSALPTLAPRVAYTQNPQAKDQRVAPPSPLRRLYGTARWKRLRKDVLLRDMFTCRMCGRLEHDTSKLVADHKRPHRGDERLFWDERNLWTLCAPCHSGAKQREEQSAPQGVWY